MGSTKVLIFLKEKEEKKSQVEGQTEKVADFLPQTKVRLKILIFHTKTSKVNLESYFFFSS